MTFANPFPPVHRGVPPITDLIERARQACVMHRVSFEGTDPHSVRVPADAVEELVQSLSATVREKIEQIVPFAPRSRTANAFSGLMWRNLAQRCEVRRFYLVPSGEDNRRRVQLQVTADRAHRLRSVPVAVTGGDAAPQIPMTTLWLIDDSVVVRQEPGDRGTGSWLVTGRRAEVDRARSLIRAASKLALDAKPAIGPDITAWLLESAEIVYQAAQMACTGSQYIDDNGCAWYHGVWQYLRLFDMVSSPTWHAEFYAEQLREAIQERGARRILISGAADYTALAFVLEAVGVHAAELDLHILDLCRTPLLACQWYAQRMAVPVTVHQADITRTSEFGAAGLDMAEPVDLVVADAFLTRFDPDGASRVIDSWYGLLAPGGTVVTTVRLHPRNEYADQDSFDLEFDSERRVTDPIDDFELRLRERATGWQDMLPIDLETLLRAGRRYAKRMISRDLGDADDIAKRFQDREFDVIRQPTKRVRGELVGTEYLQIVARRPDRSVPASSD